jgi:hypothetical protein
VDGLRKAYIINTNRTNRPGGEDEMDMLQNQKCAIYFSPWKERMHSIRPGDLVFLYGNKKGIIARGIATGVVEQGDYVNEKGRHIEEQNYMYLDRFQLLNEPMPASVINKVVEYSVVYGQTMISMEYEGGLKVWQAITKEFIYE